MAKCIILTECRNTILIIYIIFQVCGRNNGVQQFDQFSSWPDVSLANRSQPFQSHASQRRDSRNPAKVYRYTCPFCGKRFSRTNNLRGHLVVHTGIKQFVCPHCNRGYAHKQNLQKHIAAQHRLPLVAGGGRSDDVTARSQSAVEWE